MSRWIDAEWIRNIYADFEHYENRDDWTTPITNVLAVIDDAPSIDIVRCEECRKSHIDGKTTHHLWCTEWGRSTDTFGYCERGEREGE